MLLQKRIKRAMDHLRERREKRRQEEEWMPLEKGDLLAMILSALVVILPVALIVLLLMVLLPMLWMSG